MELSVTKDSLRGRYIHAHVVRTCNWMYICLEIYILQTWDLLRIIWYGFKALTADFLSRHPGYHVNPMRLNGSAVETIFSQLKYITSGQLTAVTYETAKASLLTKQAVHGTRTRDDYRDTELYIRESELQRKSKSSKAHNTTNN